MPEYGLQNKGRLVECYWNMVKVFVESDVTGRQLYVPISHSAHQLIYYDKSPHMYIYAPQALNLEG